MFDLVPFDNRSGGIFDYFDRVMNNGFFGSPDADCAPCRADILDQGDKFVLMADMPGFRKEDIKIGIDGDVLTLSAERREEANGSGENFVRRERKYGSLARSFDIQGIDTGKISASYQDGVLTLDLPKIVETKPSSRKIEIQ
ncbi:Hsp20/alpha crystallin family protein [Caproiciproducens sp. NJN-50]|uniref:Hsp20/alpha crystallin family protein n=1 Tax=Acutalibacteraceae TaxID=3082771 RepID=UPI000FFE0871|nr:MULTISPECIES: Hsp20/alpha crystallin family protein [Acutalibacteraceae]QAT50386.1 Hsp20/alpha crystallin family protein [Caproiciproducens sp. NJN-50]